MKLTSTLVGFVAVMAAPACELCAIYNANNATGESTAGFFFSVAEQYTPYETSQVNGKEGLVRLSFGGLAPRRWLR